MLIDKTITPEDPEQPEERAWVGEGVEGRKRERSGTADEGVDGGEHIAAPLSVSI